MLGHQKPTEEEEASARKGCEGRESSTEIQQRGRGSQERKDRAHAVTFVVDPPN